MTANEIITMENYIKNTTLISRKDFENRLKKFGLKLDFDMICIYNDTYECNKQFYTIKNPKVFTIDYVDSTGSGWANIYSDFYKNHTTKKSELFNEFYEFINSYTFKYKGALLT